MAEREIDDRTVWWLVERGCLLVWWEWNRNYQGGNQVSEDGWWLAQIGSDQQEMIERWPVRDDGCSGVLGRMKIDDRMVGSEVLLHDANSWEAVWNEDGGDRIDRHTDELVGKWKVETLTAMSKGMNRMALSMVE